MFEQQPAGGAGGDAAATAPLSALPDYLRPGLDLVLCGCNPGLFSASVGHYFARRGNAFWPLLAESGITPRLYAPAEDHMLLELGVGLTDVVARPTTGTADVAGREWRAGGQLLAERLRQFRPAGVCFVGDTAYRGFSGRPRARWGRQPEQWQGIEIFVVPSTSGRVMRLAAERRAAFLEVGDWLRLRRQHSPGYNAGSEPDAAGTVAAGRGAGRQALDAGPQAADSSV